MNYKEKLWKRTIHNKATKLWVTAILGSENVREIFQGEKWVPTIWNGLNQNWIELREHVTRLEVLEVWRAIGGDQITDKELEAASVVDLKFEQALAASLRKESDAKANK